MQQRENILPSLLSLHHINSNKTLSIDKMQQGKATLTSFLSLYHINKTLISFLPWSHVLGRVSIGPVGQSIGPQQHTITPTLHNGPVRQPTGAQHNTNPPKYKNSSALCLVLVSPIL
ncbi:hypothetical protein Pmani_004322 [Petrolisthes manimaculis]|uniref:Uncharacterized protein n=1 Tax=Petrolisthes manimaculis TaxID=1843537 RepID=A0AAE1QEP1_9EUCA|nr:hypothetical protein Pmani_004322 [Petrolisthes manimaculis]